MATCRRFRTAVTLAGRSRWSRTAVAGGGGGAPTQTRPSPESRPASTPSGAEAHAAVTRQTKRASSARACGCSLDRSAAATGANAEAPPPLPSPSPPAAKRSPFGGQPSTSIRAVAVHSMAAFGSAWHAWRRHAASAPPLRTAPTASRLERGMERLRSTLAAAQTPSTSAAQQEGGGRSMKGGAEGRAATELDGDGWSGGGWSGGGAVAHLWQPPMPGGRRSRSRRRRVQEARCS